jgi:hypothetical protein
MPKPVVPVGCFTHTNSNLTSWKSMGLFFWRVKAGAWCLVDREPAVSPNSVVLIEYDSACERR